MAIYLRFNVKAKIEKSNNVYLKRFMLIIVITVNGRQVLAYRCFNISIPTETVFSCGFPGFCKFNLSVILTWTFLCVCIVFGFVRQYFTGIDAVGSSSLRA